MRAQYPREILQAKKHDLVSETIWKVAIDLFHERGFDNVTVDQITERAGVSRRTFFRYYSSKESLMASKTKKYGAGLIDAIAAADSSLSGIEVAKAVIKSVLALHLDHAEILMQISERSRAAQMAQFIEVPIFERDLAAAFAGREKARHGSTMEYRVLASMVLTASGLCAEIWVAQQHRPIEKIVDEIFAAILHVCVGGWD